MLGLVFEGIDESVAVVAAVDGEGDDGVGVAGVVAAADAVVVVDAAVGVVAKTTKTTLVLSGIC